MTNPDPWRGGSFYDEALLEVYLRHRHTPVTSPNLVMEEPAFLAEAGDLRGKRILDLGCGDGTFGRECVEAACRSYLGIDGSPAMIGRATDEVDPADPTLRFELADLEDYRPESTSTDLVTSRMALHYVDDLSPVVARAYDALVEGGRLVISVVHPVVSAANAVRPGPRTSQVVDNYFVEGPRQRQWFGRPVRWQHRTVERYVEAILRAGFTLTALRECGPSEDLFDGNRAEFQRRRRVPLFLLLAAQRGRESGI